MSEQNKIQLFENQPIRTAWNEEQEEWYFSVVDVIHVLTGSENPRRYWSDLKRKLKSEGATQLYENIVQLKMKSSDGKNYKTDAATTEQLLRIIQSIPSPRAEPVKRWLAEVGRERIEETIDPEQAIDRALETYLKKGYDPDWVHQRLLSILMNLRRNNSTNINILLTRRREMKDYLKTLKQEKSNRFFIGIAMLPTRRCFISPE